MMQDLFFYLFAALTLLCGFLVVANPFSRNPVTSAMFLVLTIVSLAGLFVLLHAFFLAAVQVLIYAGAVSVPQLVTLVYQEGEPSQARVLVVAAGFGLLYLGTGIARQLSTKGQKLDAIASATPRSAPGSSSLKPPVTVTNTS